MAALPGQLAALRAFNALKEGLFVIRVLSFLRSTFDQLVAISTVIHVNKKGYDNNSILYIYIYIYTCLEEKSAGISHNLS